MRITKSLTAVIGVSAILSFLYGMATVKYQLFPYEQLKSIKQILIPKQKQKLGHSRKFYERKSFFEKHGRSNYDVVFIGDSITHGAEWEDLFPSLDIANRGVGGDRTNGVLERIESISNTNAKKAFIMIGVNDFSAGIDVDEVYENYREIVNRLTENDMLVYVQSTILGGKQVASRNTDIMALNSRLQELAEENESVTYIDLNAGLAKDSLLSPLYSRDGTHLNGEGYAIWKGIIMKYLQ